MSPSFPFEWRVPRQPLLVLCLLFLVALEGSRLQAGVPQARGGDGQSARPGTWSARSSTGRTLGGTWTAIADPTTGTVTGTWTLIDAGGRPATRGGWSAAKSRTGWTGAWRAAVSLAARASIPARGAPASISKPTRALRICSRRLCRQSSAATGGPADSRGRGRYGRSSDNHRDPF